MSIPGPKSIYRLLGLLVAMVVAGGLLLLLMAESPNAQEAQEEPTAQEEPPLPSINKECTPDPVQLGQQLTCTIDVVAATDTEALFQVTDTLPSNLTVTEEDTESLLIVGETNSPDTFEDSQGFCDVVGNTVTCPSELILNEESGDGLVISYRVIIKATAEQCGTAENTATAEEGIVVSNSGVGFFEGSDVQDTESITVEGCPDPGPGPGPGPGGDGGGADGSGDGGSGGGGGGSGGGGSGGGGATPITQESVQESEAGELDQNFEVS